MSIEAMKQARDWIAERPDLRPISAGKMISIIDRAIEAAEKQEPVAWMDRDGDLYAREPDKNWCPPHYPLYTTPPAAPVQEPAKCWCTTCRPITPSDMRFVVCPECGNKRCPKANDHRNACTNSNEPGQPGSSWEHVKPAAHSACGNALRSQGLPYPRTCKECGLGPCKHLAALSADHPRLPEYPQSEGLNDPALEYAKNVPESWTPEEVRLWQDLQIESRNKANLRKYALELRKILDQTLSILNAQDRVYECARRLVEHADFQLGGVLSADSKARDIPSNAVSQVKARHLAALRDALAAMPKQEGGDA